jgi:hypothetical protein
MGPSERAAEMNRLSRLLEKHFPRTSKWLKRLSEDMLLPKVTLDEIKADWNDVKQAFKNEFVGSDENWKYREECYMALEKTINGMIGKLGLPKSKETFDKILPELETGTEALNNLGRIYLELVKSKNLSESGRYYSMCFMYLLFVEGVYDENIRVLYTFRKATDGVSIDYEAIKDRSIRSFESELDPVFFEGYNDRIRNAIAHAKFNYDDASKLMSFRDRANRFQPEYSKSLSLKEFVTQCYSKLDDFCSLVIFYTILLGARDFVFAPRPLGKVTLKDTKAAREQGLGP